jgi:transcription initiation factor IIE alpha subunit
MRTHVHINTPKHVQVSDMQERVLKVLATLENGYSMYFREIAKRTRLSKRQVRLAARALTRKGLAEYTRGLFDDDGHVMGSGYGCTRLGYEQAALTFLKSHT